MQGGCHTGAKSKTYILNVYLWSKRVMVEEREIKKRGGKQEIASGLSHSDV